jgi:hypothetical protein
MGKSPEDDTLVKRFWMFPVFSKGDKFLKRRLQFTTTSTTTTTTAPRLFFV